MKNKVFIATAGVLGLGLAFGSAKTVGAEEVIDNGQPAWRVEQGDTLSDIANIYGINFQDISNANDSVVDENLIFVDDILHLPLNQEVEQPVEEAPIQEEVPVQEEVEESVVEEPAEETVVEEEPVVEETPVQEAPETQQEATGSEAEAKAWIANKESGNDYGAQNGRYIGKFQLDSSYLKGDYSPANQERVAEQYVSDRYGSWSNAKQEWQQKGWY